MGEVVQGMGWSRGDGRAQGGKCGWEIKTCSDHAMGLKTKEEGGVGLERERRSGRGVKGGGFRDLKNPNLPSRLLTF